MRRGKLIGGDAVPSGAVATAAPKFPGPAASASGVAGARLVRVAPDGERFWPHRFADGLYRVADPGLGRVKHHAANQIGVTEEEIAGYLRRGYLLRMRGEASRQVNLIPAAEIVQTDALSRE